MATSTRMNKEALTQFQPRERALYEREGFDRKNVRYEFSNTNALGLNDRYIEDEEVTLLNHETSDLPQGPTEIGETAGSGVNFVVQDGEMMKTWRFTAGFTQLMENVMAGHFNASEQVRQIMEMIDFFNDKQFLTGVRDRSGGVIEPGIFSWLKSNIPAERTFNCTDFTDDTTDDSYPDIQADGRQENLIKRYAFETISGRLMNPDDPKWDLMVGRQQALAVFNQRTNADGGTTPRETYWERINNSGGVGVGVRDYKLIPDQLQFSEAPEGQTPLTIDLSAELGPDEVLLLPDMNQVRQKYWQLYEQPSPETFNSDADGGRTRLDYVWRYRHRFDPTGKHGEATDAILLQNVSTLFN